MSIASRIEEMNVHVTDAYDTIEMAQTVDYDKNIDNLDRGIKDAYLQMMNEGHEKVWDAWEKGTSEGEELNIDGAETAPMKVLLKGNTYQNTTTGKNLFNKNNITYDMLSIYENTSAGATRIVSSDTMACVYIQIAPNSEKFSISGMGKSYDVAALTSIPVDGGGDAVYTWTFRNTQTGNYTTPSLPSSCTYLAIFFGPGDSTIAEVVENLQIEKSDTVTSYEPYTGGNPAPNPDFPMPVHVVSGDNEVKVVGKNYFNEALLSQETNYNTYNSSTGLWTTSDSSGYSRSLLYSATGATGTRDITKLIKLEAGTYTIKFYDYANNTGQSTNGLQFALFDNTGTLINNIVRGDATTTFTTTSNGYLDIRRYSNSGTFSFSKVQLEKGSSATNWVKHQSTTYPINLPEGMFLGSIGDYKDGFIRNSGKNLFSSELELGSINNSTGATESNNSSLRTKDYIEVEPNTQYIISNDKSYACYTYEYDKDYNFLNAYAGAAYYNQCAFTTTENTKYIKVRSIASATQNDLTTKYTLNRGTTALPYEPYGNGYWYLKKEIGKEVFTGTSANESWENATQYETTNFYRYENTTYRTNNCLVHSEYLSDNFKYNGTSSLTANNTITNTSSTGANRLWITIDTTLMNGASVSDFTTWLSTHNTTVYYVLATPTYTKIEGTLASQLESVYRAKSEEGQTNISQTNDDLPFVIDVTYLLREE